mgnify:CR=1 FL=1
MVYTPTASPSLRIGIMGGTFDPIHHGHLVAASEVANLFHLDEVIFVPTGQPWQKSEREVSAAEDRYLMTVIATASNPRFSVSRVDIDRPGPTYTIDTLSDLHNIFPTAELFFITGADALEKILTWREWEKAFDYATFVGVTRPGYLLRDTNLPEKYQDRVELVQIPAMAISSTDCRRRKTRLVPCPRRRRPIHQQTRPIPVTTPTTTNKNPGGFPKVS